MIWAAAQAGFEEAGTNSGKLQMEWNRIHWSREMVARLQNPDEDGDVLDADDVGSIHILTEEEAWDFFNDQALKTLGLSGEEFLKRWDRGEFFPVPDTREGWPVSRLAMLIPFVSAKNS